jgi:hypothetical protein
MKLDDLTGGLVYRLEQAIRRVPFRSFAIRLADGSEIPVPSPDMVAHAPGTSTAAVALPDGTIETMDLFNSRGHRRSYGGGSGSMRGVSSNGTVMEHFP